MRTTRHLVRSLVAAVALATLLTPATASADLRATAFGGVARINETNKGIFGAAVTFGGLLGFEFDAARINLGLLDNIEIVDVDTSITTYMGNLVLRAPTGPIQPYGSIGAGVIRASGDVTIPLIGTVFSEDAQSYAWNVGGGVYVLPTPHLGFRADVRRFQTGDIDWEDITGIGDLPLPQFNFWRGTVGVTFKF